MDLKVGGDEFQALVSKAIIDSLSPETREKLITDAIRQSLTTPESGGGYGSTKARSPLQKAFDLAVADYAHRYAAATLADDPAFKSQIEALFPDVAKRLFEDQRDDLVNGIANTIRIALTKDRY